MSVMRMWYGVHMSLKKLLYSESFSKSLQPMHCIQLSSLFLFATFCLNALLYCGINDVEQALCAHSHHKDRTFICLLAHLITHFNIFSFSPKQQAASVTPSKSLSGDQKGLSE